MTTTTTPQSTPTRARWPARLLAAVGLTALAFGAVVGITSAAGYGHDLHLFRVLATVGVLLVAMLLLVWPARTSTAMIAGLLLALLAAPAAWLLVPSRSDGPHLYGAAVKRDAALRRLESLPSDDVNSLAGVRDSINSFVADFPRLSQNARAALDTRGEELVEARIKELRDLSGTDDAGFRDSAPAREALADALPQTRVRLIEAEEQWATRWAKFTAVGYTEGGLNPTFVRKGCLEGEQLVLQLPTLDESPGRLMEARRVFFHAAHGTVEKQIAALHKEKQFDRAAGIALSHKTDWGKIPGLLTAEEWEALEALHKHCQALQLPGGDTDPIPPPRVIETAPTPRPRDSGDKQ